MQHSNAIKIATATVCGLAIPAVLWYFFRPLNWRDAQVAFERALVGGDTKPLERFYDEDELRAFGITSQQATQIARETIEPIMKGVRLLPPERQPLQQGSMISIPRGLVVGGQERIPAGTDVLNSEDGPKVQFSYLAMAALWVVQARGIETNDTGWRAKYAEVANEFTSRGISGLWVRSSGKIMPWPPPRKEPDSPNRK